MPGYIIQWYDETGKVYKEVTSTQPLPVTTVGGGAGGAEQVQVTSAGGDAITGGYATAASSTVGLDTNARVMGQNGTNAMPIEASNMSSDNNDPAAIGMLVNARLMGFDGTNFDRIKIDQATGDILTKIDGGSGTATTRQGNADAQAATDVGLLENARLYAFNGTTYDRLRVDANKNLLTSNAQIWTSTGTNGNAWNAAAVSAGGTSAVIDISSGPYTLIWGTVGAANTITVQASQDGTTFFDTAHIASPAAAGGFSLNPTLACKFIRLKATNADTITATVAVKG